MSEQAPNPYQRPNDFYRQYPHFLDAYPLGQQQSTAVWLAGLLDVAGTISYVKDKRQNISPTITYNDNDPARIRTLIYLLGGTTYTHSQSKVSIRWQLNGVKAYSLIGLIAPHVVIRRDKVNLALEMQRSSDKDSKIKLFEENKKQSQRLVRVSEFDSALDKPAYVAGVFDARGRTDIPIKAIEAKKPYALYIGTKHTSLLEAIRDRFGGGLVRYSRAGDLMKGYQLQSDSYYWYLSSKPEKIDFLNYISPHAKLRSQEIDQFLRMS